MSLVTKSAQQHTASQLPSKRLWRVPVSRVAWLWLAFSLLLAVGIFGVYLQAVRTQQFPGPFYDPLRFFGILAFALVLLAAAYSLRRRFVRGLPGKAQNWLWMHTWIGIVTVLIVLLHSNFVHILNNYCHNLSCLTEAGAGTSAMIALGVLVVSGVLGRLLDSWQARTISHEASTNGVGIARALEERILEQEYTVERLCAGKSEAFKTYCMKALDRARTLSGPLPSLDPHEQADFRRAHRTLSQRARLVRSLRRQQRARAIIRAWRAIHIIIATIALLIITYHSLLELLANVLNLRFLQPFG